MIADGLTNTGRADISVQMHPTPLSWVWNSDVECFTNMTEDTHWPWVKLEGTEEHREESVRRDGLPWHGPDLLVWWDRLV